MRLQDIIPSKLVFSTWDWVEGDGYLIMTFNGLHLPDLNEELHLEIDNYIYKLFIQTTKKKIIVDLGGEGISSEPLIMITALLKGVIEKYSVSVSDIYIRCGAAPVKENVIKYFNHCKTFNTIPFNIQFQNSYEHNAVSRLTSKLEFYNVFDATPRLKQKVFLSFNKNTRLHRLYLTSEIIRRKLLDKAFFSMYIEYSVINCNNTYLGYLIKNIEQFFPKNYKRVDKILTENKNLFPLELNYDLSNHAPMDVVNDITYFNESYFSLVTETKCLRDLPGIHDTQLDCYLFSEKTYKPILAKHPFILMSIPGSLSVLREAGYKTFHPYINESYDDIKNDEDRIEAIIDEVERLSRFTDNEWLIWQESIKDIVEHNFINLKNSKLIKLESNNYQIYN